jgi:hypothetical protein
MRCDEMRRDEMRWDEMRCDGANNVLGRVAMLVAMPLVVVRVAVLLVRRVLLMLWMVTVVGVGVGMRVGMGVLPCCRLLERRRLCQATRMQFHGRGDCARVRTPQTRGWRGQRAVARSGRHTHG